MMVEDSSGDARGRVDEAAGFLGVLGEDVVMKVSGLSCL